MDHFEYISALISIAVALGLAEMLVSWAYLLRHRQLVRFDMLPLAISALLALLLVQFWWGFWNYRSLESWSFGTLLLSLAGIACIVLAGLVLLPKDLSTTEVDLRDHYLAQRQVFFPLVATTFVFFTLNDAYTLGQPLWHPENAVRGLGIVVCGIGAFSASVAVHRAIVAVSVGLIAIFLGVAIEV